MYWKEKADRIYERKLSLTDPVVIRINHIRQSFHFYFIPAIEQAMNAPKDEQVQFVKCMSLFASEEKWDHFMKHFYAIDFEEQGDWSFLDRDAGDQDVFVLYDLYKTKKTIEAIEAIAQEIKQEENSFPSQFDAFSVHLREI